MRCNVPCVFAKRKASETISIRINGLSKRLKPDLLRKLLGGPGHCGTLVEAGTAGANLFSPAPCQSMPVSGTGTSADPYVYSTDVTENGAFSEGMVGCSTCHYGAGVADGHAARGAHERARERRHLRPVPLALRQLQAAERHSTHWPAQCRAAPSTRSTPSATRCSVRPAPTGWVDALPLTDIINVPDAGSPGLPELLQAGRRDAARGPHARTKGARCSTRSGRWKATPTR